MASRRLQVWELPAAVLVERVQEPSDAAVPLALKQQARVRWVPQTQRAQQVEAVQPGAPQLAVRLAVAGLRVPTPHGAASWAPQAGGTPQPRASRTAEAPQGEVELEAPPAVAAPQMVPVWASHQWTALQRAGGGTPVAVARPEPLEPLEQPEQPERAVPPVLPVPPVVQMTAVPLAALAQGAELMEPARVLPDEEVSTGATPLGPTAPQERRTVWASSWAQPARAAAQPTYME